MPFEKEDAYGAYVDLPLTEDAKEVGFLVLDVTNGDKDGEDKNFNLLDYGLRKAMILFTFLLIGKSE